MTEQRRKGQTDHTETFYNTHVVVYKIYSVVYLHGPTKTLGVIECLLVHERHDKVLKIASELGFELLDEVLWWGEGGEEERCKSTLPSIAQQTQSTRDRGMSDIFWGNDLCPPLERLSLSQWSPLCISR